MPERKPGPLPAAFPMAFIAPMMWITFASGQALSLTGKVVDAQSGAPIAGAQVRLLAKNLSAATDAAGTFSFKTSSLSGGREAPRASLAWEGGAAASLEIAGLSAGATVEIRDLQGQLRFRAADQATGDRRYAWAGGPGIYTVRVALAGRAYSATAALAGPGARVTVPLREPGAPLARSGAIGAVDSLAVSKAGYQAKTVPVPAYTADLGSIALDKAEGCAKPAFTTTDPNGGWSNGGYYVHNNMWNCSHYACAETLYACSYRDWYVVAKMDNQNKDGAVKTYPNVHKDYNDVPISSFKTLTSTFAATSPHVGIYDVAYDIWTNGVASNGSTEFMIWTENYNQVPSGSHVADTTFSGHTFAVWKTKDNGYIAFLPDAPLLSGDLDILAIFKWTMAKGWLRANSTLGQLDFGVEIVSTDGKPAPFYFTDFSISSTNN